MRLFHVNRRVIAVICTLAVVFTIFAGATVTVGPIAVGPQPVLANGGNCSDSNSDLYDAAHSGGTTNSSAGTSRSGIAADLYLDTTITGFRKCKPQPPFDTAPSGAFAFLELYPRNAIGGCPAGALNGECYLRLGVARCTTLPALNNPFCNDDTSETQPAYVIFVDRKGCGNSRVVTTYPSASFGTEPYNVYFWDDAGTWKFFWEAQHLGSTSENDSRLACWIINGVNAAGWWASYFDHQDSIGTEGNYHSTKFTNARYGVENQGWINPQWSSNSACLFEFSAGSGGECLKGLAGVNDDIGFYTYD